MENEHPKFEPCEEVNKPFTHSSIESASSIKSDISFSLDKSSNLDITLDDLGCSDGDMHDFYTGDTKKNNLMYRLRIILQLTALYQLPPNSIKSVNIMQRIQGKNLN